MISAAVHIVFLWILGLTLQAKTVQTPTPKPEIQQEQKAPEPTPEKIEPAVTPVILTPS